MCSCGLIGSQCFSASCSINLLYRSTNSSSPISHFMNFSDKFIYVSGLIASIRSLNSFASIFPAISISCSILDSWFMGHSLPSSSCFIYFAFLNSIISSGSKYSLHFGHLGSIFFLYDSSISRNTLLLRILFSSLFASSE